MSKDKQIELLKKRVKELEARIAELEASEASLIDRYENNPGGTD
jgi:BMFP domain-containing protein YqiC